MFNISETIGEIYELIVIDNRYGKYSICQAYNIGINKSRGEYVCFVHEDVIFKTNNWGNNLIKHLCLNNVGLIGVAGSSIITRVPAPWSSYYEGKKMNIIQICTKKNNKIHITIPKGEDDSTMNRVLLLDGVFLATKRSNLQILQFDENLLGFHGYDFDISLQSLSNGYVNYVVYDILLEHNSLGIRNGIYYRNLIQVFKKHEKIIALYSNSFNNKYLEYIQLKKFCRRLINSGIEKKEVFNNLDYYSMYIHCCTTMYKIYAYLKFLSK